MTKESLDVAQHAADSLVDFGIDGIVDNLIGFRLEHLINHLPTGEVLGYHVYTLIDEAIDSGVNCCIHSEVANVLEMGTRRGPSRRRFSRCHIGGCDASADSG